MVKPVIFHLVNLIVIDTAGLVVKLPGFPVIFPPIHINPVEDHGPCHAVDCIDKTVRVRNDAEAVERMLGQADFTVKCFR